MPSELDRLKDLGLTYKEAAHGVQSHIAYGIQIGEHATEPKHLRLGIDMEKADTLGLVCLLMDKGVITPEEYHEYLRRAANHELAMRQDESGLEFR